MMTSIKGIEIEKDEQGVDAFIRIDLNQYGKQLEPFLLEVGVLDEFDSEWKKGLSLDEAKEQSIQKIKSWWKK